MINNPYNKKIGISKGNSYGNPSLFGNTGSNTTSDSEYKWFAPKKYGIGKSEEDPNNISLLSKNDRKSNTGAITSGFGDTKKSSEASNGSSKIKNTLLSLTRSEKASEYLSDIPDNLLEQNYSYANDSYDIARAKGGYFPCGKIYPYAMAAALSLREIGNKEGEKFFDLIAHDSSYSKAAKSTSKAIDSTFDSVINSLKSLGDTRSSSKENTAERYNEKNNSRRLSNNPDTKIKSTSVKDSNRDTVSRVEDFSKEVTESGILIEEALYLVADLMDYNDAVFHGNETEEWSKLDVGYGLNKNSDDIREKRMSNRLRSWKKIAKYKFEGLDMAVYSKYINGKRHIAVVNSGSYGLFNYKKNTKEFIYDWGDNTGRYFGASDDVKKSIEYAKKVVEKYKDAEITFIGYSKGGAEAAANAMATNKAAVLFNPALPRNLDKYNIDAENYDGKMISYIVSGELLNETDGRWFNKLPGDVKYVGEDVSPWSSLSKLSIDSLSDITFYNAFEEFSEICEGIVKEFARSADSHMLSSFINKSQKEGQ